MTAPVPGEKTGRLKKSQLMQSVKHIKFMKCLSSSDKAHVGEESQIKTVIVYIQNISRTQKGGSR